MKAFRQEVSERAYDRWVRNGQPHGTEVQDWLEVETELTLLSEQARQIERKASLKEGQLLQAILENSTAVIFVKDLHGRYVLVNRRYETLFQVTLEQVIGRTAHDFFPKQIADEVRANDLRVLDAKTPLEFEELVPHGGEAHTYLSLKFPISGPTGSPYAVCGICTDISARKQAERRLLAEHTVTSALARSFALGSFSTVLQAVCEGLGWDVGIYWEVDRRADVLGCAEVWHTPSGQVAKFERLSRGMSFPRGVGLPGRVWASGEPSLIADIGAEAGCPRAAVALEEGLHKACGFPVRNAGEPLGVLEFYSQAIREHDQNVLDMMARVSSQVGQFMERRQAEKAFHERDREFNLARVIQQNRLPRVPPTLAGFDIAGASHPAQETGGDYLDFIALPEGSLGIAVGDASGHGIGAALLITETRAYLRALVRTDTNVGKILSLVNRQIVEDIGEDFVTLFFARLDPRTRSLVYSSAGHWPGYVLDRRGEMKTILHSTGLPLGLDPTAAFPESVAQTLDPGDLVLLLSDGIVEAFSPDGPLFGMERVLKSVRAHRGATSDRIVAALVEEVRAYSNDLPIDDMTAVVIQAKQA